MKKPIGLYVASRVARAEMWRQYRHHGMPIISSWIDEVGPGETACFGELWSRIESEIRGSVGLIFYGDTRDAPWKGAFVEVGMALAMGLPVAAVVIGELGGPTLRPVGSWLKHPLVKQYPTVEQAVWALMGW